MIHILENIGRWKCEYKKCGAKCCSEGIQLTIEDIKRIKGLGYLPEDFLDFDETDIVKIKGKDGKCFFIGNELECTIRGSEPLICRLLPFRIVEVTYSDEPLMKLGPVVQCPGVGQGKRIDKKKIEHDATLFLRQNQELIREIKRKGKKRAVVEIE